MSKKFWSIIWNVSEFTGIGLGKYAPYVFEKMLGINGIELDDLGNKISKSIREDCDFCIGRNGIMITKYIKWLFSNREYPKPMVIVPLDGWISDKDEIIRSIRMDDDMGIKNETE